MEIAPGIRRVGEGVVNAYLVADGGAVTIVDAGAPAYWDALPRELTALGRRLEDVRAVVLTHAHADHIGFAERIRRERGVPVRVHEADALLAQGRATAKQRTGPVRPIALLRFLAFAVRAGMLRIPPVREVVAFGDGATLDVPGAPRVVHVPGHSAGSAALHFASHGALFVGDALGTLNVVTGATGPQLMPFTVDFAEALRSLDRLRAIDAALVLPGHGAPWTGGAEEAVRRAAAASAHLVR